jgi:hypothetical protein
LLRVSTGGPFIVADKRALIISRPGHMEVTLNGGGKTRHQFDIHVNVVQRDWFTNFSKRIQIEGCNFVNFHLNVCYCSPDIVMKIMWSDKADFKVSDHVTNVNKLLNSVRGSH